MKKLGIYIHIPFCVKKCGYCDFYSVKWDEESENKYIHSAINEIKSYNELSSKYVVDSIYIGGGTPSIINPKNLEKIISTIRCLFTVEENSEISMEANPNSLWENIKTYGEIGINRLSIGIQSLNDNILKRIGRIHNSKEALQAIDRAISFGFENINADVMFNIPGQTVDDINDTISKLVTKQIRHISFYSLKLEEGTPMYLLKKNKKIVMPEEDLEREMYYAGRNIMEKHGLMQYEISNFSVKGYECRHNLKYWKQEEYIGIGPSAHSFLGNVRFSNPSDLTEYITSGENGVFERNTLEEMDENDIKFEYIMLRLRLTEGLKFADFKNKFSIDFKEAYKEQIKHLTENNLIESDDDAIRLTKRGMDVSNYVLAQF
ncbi:MAG: radical SAM family heme chaperone HemW [Sedimentibacter sp.]|jgi:oxygen-independent coproporphyrinogen-3 oxidase|nr:radical SAM family heme chaperone HemW [Sedimentibacter sp.]